MLVSIVATTNLLKDFKQLIPKNDKNEVNCCGNNLLRPLMIVFYGKNCI